jgi:formamidopyrimidine-DNA glycosylase
VLAARAAIARVESPAMPELPEIEVLRRSLEPRLLGRRIRSVETGAVSLREPLRPQTLRRRAEGQRVLTLRRRAKYLLLDLSGDSSLVIHLGMSGRLTLAPERAPRELHEHLTFHLDRGEKLRFRDPRRFGLALALPTAGVERDPHFVRLGVEPLGEGFSGEVLERLSAGRRGPVKSFLMDAGRVVGVGNIYASESLHRAGIHPERSVARISSSRWEALARAVVEVLETAIAEGGTTLNDFTDGLGEEGYFQVSLRVYDREGAPCARCGGTVRRRVQAGRSTYFCPRCQR